MKATSLLLLIVTALIMASCTKYPPSSDRLLEDLAIYTKYDVSVDFSGYQSYYLSDSIIYIDENDSGWVYNDQVQSLTATVAQNMNDRGYVRTWNEKATDLAITVAMVKNVNVSVYYPGWFWGYPGYYPPGYWGGYGGYYYPYDPAYVTSYSTGTILIDMLDLKNPSSENKIPVRWNAYIRGLLTGSHTLSDIEKSIDQAFAQTKGFPSSH